MAETTAAPNVMPKLWVITRGFGNKRALIESDHMLLLSGGGYKDTMRRILFNRIERIYVTDGPPLSGWEGLGLLLFIIDALICALVVVSRATVMTKIVLLVLIGWPLPLLAGWAIFPSLTPTHRLFIIRAGWPYEIRIKLSRANYARFYSELCLRIRQYQGQSAVAGAVEGAPTDEPSGKDAVAAEPTDQANASATIEGDTAEEMS